MEYNPIFEYYINLLNTKSHCIFANAYNSQMFKSISKYIVDKCIQKSNYNVYCFNSPTIFNDCRNYLNDNMISIINYEKYYLKNNSKILYLDVENYIDVVKLDIKSNIIIFNDDIYDPFESGFIYSEIYSLLINSEKFIYYTLYTKNDFIEYLKNNFTLYFDYKNRDQLKNIILYIRKEKIKNLEII